jgi:hypothetical protein
MGQGCSSAWPIALGNSKRSFYSAVTETLDPFVECSGVINPKQDPYSVLQ